MKRLYTQVIENCYECPNRVVRGGYSYDVCRLTGQKVFSEFRDGIPSDCPLEIVEEDEEQ